jgi:creatinine amidohydrolase
VTEGWPLLVPAGCIEYHGPHLALGLDTLLVEYLCQRVAQRVECVVAPAFWYGPTGYAVSGPDQGTVDVSTERFGRHVKDVLSSFWAMGFRWIIVAQHHQQLGGPEALAIRQAAAEVTFEKSHAARGDAWWGKAPLPADDNVFERIQVWPSVLPAAAEAQKIVVDHAGYTETSLLLAAHPEFVQMARLDANAPWFANTPDGPARDAGAQAGARMWDVMVDAWVARLAGLRQPRRRPTPEELTITGLF